jgi:hypothetical protein
VPHLQQTAPIQQERLEGMEKICGQQ